MTTGAPPPPEVEFDVLGAEAIRHEAAPGLRFRLRARDPGGLEIATVALSIQIQVEPVSRRYDPETRARLVELFGDPSQWTSSAKPIAWGRLAVLVPRFATEVEFDATAAVSFDLDVGLAKYLHALHDGDIPLSFHFSGTVLYRDAEERLQMVMVPWTRASFALPVATWRAAVEAHFPGRAWVGVSRETLERLVQYRTTHGMTSLDAGLAALLDGAEASVDAAETGLAP